MGISPGSGRRAKGELQRLSGRGYNSAPKVRKQAALKPGGGAQKSGKPPKTGIRY